jgi:hypothetical protein
MLLNMGVPDLAADGAATVAAMPVPSVARSVYSP